MKEHTSRELYHFGIKGMKWGVWNEETKARHLGGKSSSIPNNKRRKGLSDNQKKLIKIGSAAVATGLVSYGAYKLYKNGAFNPALSVNKDFSVKGIDFDSIAKRSINPNGSPEEFAKSMEYVNPNSSHDNCGPCGIAGALGINGVKLKARPDFDTGTKPYQLIQQCFNLGFSESEKVIKEINNDKVRTAQGMREILNRRYPEGSSGLVSLSKLQQGNTRQEEYGHAFSWYKRGDGDIVFFDSQNRRVDASLYFSLCAKDSTTLFARLDNLTLDKDKASKYFEFID